MKETILGILLWVFVSFLGNLAALWVFNQADVAWECRAQQAGYYETMPKEMQRN